MTLEGENVTPASFYRMGNGPCDRSAVILQSRAELFIAGSSRNSFPSAAAQSDRLRLLACDDILGVFELSFVLSLFLIFYH